MRPRLFSRLHVHLPLMLLLTTVAMGPLGCTPAPERWNEPDERVQTAPGSQQAGIEMGSHGGPATINTARHRSASTYGEAASATATLQNSPLQSRYDSHANSSALGLTDNRFLFAEPVSDPVERIRRIEMAVQNLRNDFDTAIPALAGLVVSENELTQVLEDLKRGGDLRYSDIHPYRQGNEEMPSRPSDLSHYHGQIASSDPSHAQGSAKGHKPTPISGPLAEHNKLSSSATPKTRSYKTKTTADQDTPKIKSSASPSSTTSKVLQVRTGTHPDKTRIVLDLSAPAKAYDIDIDNGEKLLLVEVKGTNWSTADTYFYKNSPLLASYLVQEEGLDGVRILFTLKKPVKLLKKFSLKADGTKNHRIVLDIAPE